MKILNNKTIECYLGIDKAEFTGIYLYDKKPYIEYSSSEIEFLTSSYCSELFESDKDLLKTLDLEKGKCYKVRLTIMEDITSSIKEKE